MGLSRLDNFLKSTRGTILYVDPNSLDSTDSIENSGNSLTRPFKTLQRALIESARFSYQRGLNNDRFNKTTILLYPGDHIVDNRPGYIPTASGTYSARSGATGLTDFVQWDLDSNFDLATPDNDLYKLNSIYGGVIVPRGTSIVGMDLRKTKIRPLYVPNPQNNNIERSCIFRVTGGCYFWQFTILDADPNENCYKDYTENLFVPNFSHHKLSGFEYADGVNSVSIEDDFLTYSTTRTDLDMYYEKVAAAYGASSGREISPDYGAGTVDIQPVIDEYRIVGPKGASVGISSIRAGNGATSTSTITVDLIETVEGLSVDSPIQISGVGASGYDGQYVIATVPSSTRITYQVQNPPTNPLPPVPGSSLNLVVDTVTSASPYIFNCSLRSVYGMCGLLADGDKATGFKSMVVAQYTGIGLQKDDNAFVKYDTSSGNYRDSTSIIDLHTNSRARFKPEYENFHIKATNDAFLQLVSVFAIGYAQHFVTENGGDIALNNSNSNFGAKALVSSGFRKDAFSQDDYGYITHIIPPKEIDSEEITLEFESIDVGLTTSKSAGAGTTDRLYLYNQIDQNNPPNVIVDGYSIGAKSNEILNIQSYQSGSVTTYSSRVVMPYGPYDSTQSSSRKSFAVGRSAVGINSINTSDYTLTLTQPHSFINGESIRIVSDNGHLPDGLEQDQIYYAITKESATGIGTNQIRIAKSLNDAINGGVTGSAIQINNKGGTLNIVSRVSDKKSGDIGHPVQWDLSGNWYINVSTSSNGIYNAINSLGTGGIGNATSRSYATRKPDNRSLIDTLYRIRYVLPKTSPVKARPPLDGFILQESNNIVGTGATEISQLYSDSGAITGLGQLRNPKFIASASWSSNAVTIRTELPHGLKTGDQVEIVNVNPTGYNGTYTVTSIPSLKEFKYSLNSNPGLFANDTSTRDGNLPYFGRKKYNKTYQVYKSQEIQSYISGVQDGIYYLTLVNHSNAPTVTPFTQEYFSQPIENLYPQLNKDNSNSDPNASRSYALPSLIGKVTVNDPQNSITKETLESFVVGSGITDIHSSSGTTHTIYTSVDHGLSGITSVSIVTGGSNYGSGTGPTNLYNAQLVGFAGSTTGSNATAVIAIDGSGTITSVKIIDGGSAYGIGNTLRVVGVATTTGFVQGVVRVESISDNIGDAIKVSGITSALNSGYNTLYRITGITTSNQIDVVSSESISNTTPLGLDSTVTINSGYVPTGKVLTVSSFSYTPTSGIATVGFTTSHGFLVDNKIRISGANESAFNGDFIVNRINSLVSLQINVGVSATTSTSATGTLYGYRSYLTSFGGNLLAESENISGRVSYEYAGITTTISSQYLTSYSDLTNNLSIPNAVSLGLQLGDYLLINSEIFRVRTAVTSNSVSVFRSVLGTRRQTHDVGSVVRRIKVTPVELRRNSIIRASGHTFEYLGYGPGNYSTSLPDKQDRLISREEKFLAQATKTDGGIVVYTGMDSEGAFYVGNKKINSTTGQEETYDIPIPTVTGDNDSNNLINISESQKVFVESSIKVEGGQDKNSISEFNGPVIFNSKVTANSELEVESLFLQGQEEISRKISIGSEKPTISGNYGDIEFNSIPVSGSNAGWIYTTNNEWKSFGFIGDVGDYSYGVGISSGGNYVGFSTLINITGTGLTITAINDATSGITTVNFNATPQSQTIGVSSGPFNTFIGLATQFNFVGYGITVTTDYSSITGIATVSIIGTASTGIGTTSSPGLPNKSIQYNNSSVFSGVPIFFYNDTNNSLAIEGSSSNSLLRISQTGAGNALIVEDEISDQTSFVITNNGSVGIGSTIPTSKLEIDAGTQQAVYIKSSSGSGNIIRVDDSVGDTSPLVYTTTGSLGLGTATSINEKLDVIGNIGLNGALRLYNPNRTAYSAIKAPTGPGNLLFTLPNSYGTNGQVLTSNGSGGLSWTTVSTGSGGGTISQLLAGSGINITSPFGPISTITNTGILDVVAGLNVSITKTNGVATISATGTGGVVIGTFNGALYPFTTRGFSIPI